MVKYFLKRILLFIPTLLLITVLTFFLSRSAPGDPVEDALELEDIAMTDVEYELLYRQTAENMGLDKPLFYFQLSAAAFPDTLYKIIPQTHRHTLRQLIQQYGDWVQIQDYYHAIKDFRYRFNLLPDSIISTQKSIVNPALKKLLLNAENQVIEYQLTQIENNTPTDLVQYYKRLTAAYDRIKKNATIYKNRIPSFRWHGTNNQYHHWLANVIKGDLGASKVDGRPVGSKIMDALRWTLLINGIAIFLVYIIAIPLGVGTAVRKGTKLDKFTSLTMFMLHSLPNFWIAILLIVFFTNPQFGMDWFPAMGLGDIPVDASFWTMVRIRAAHLILPIFCIVYPALAFVLRQMRGAMAKVLDQDYIRTARAKGVSQKDIVWKHAFRNSLFPIITLFASLLPATISGSVVIEQIFGIPGMGKLMIESIIQHDWSVVFGILILAALLTMLGILIADMLYAMADPRIKLGKE